MKLSIRGYMKGENTAISIIIAIIILLIIALALIVVSTDNISGLGEKVSSVREKIIGSKENSDDLGKIDDIISEYTTNTENT